MLLDRSRPNDQQKFSDYLNDLGKKNGFSDIQTFKKFLINSSRKWYCIYSFDSIDIFRVISGLDIEFGIDCVVESDGRGARGDRGRDRYPENWSWNKIAEYPCVGPTFTSKKIEPLQQLFKTKNKEEYCGLIQCSMSKLGLNTSPLSDRIYFADLIPEGTLSSKKYGLIKKYL